jgi:hypothetical protein
LGTSAQNSEKVIYQGQLTAGKIESIVIYLSAETDDLLGFCFRNKSRVGRAILAKCRNGQECEFTGKVDWRRHCAFGESFQSEAEIVSVTKVRKIANGK